MSTSPPAYIRGAFTSNVAYAASKGAVISLTRTASRQLAKFDINVNSVCPGVTLTALSNDNLAVLAREAGISVEEMQRRRVADIPLGRANDLEDIAAMVVFLASPGARNITEQNYNVDGGIIPERGRRGLSTWFLFEDRCNRIVSMLQY